MLYKGRSTSKLWRSAICIIQKDENKNKNKKYNFFRNDCVYVCMHVCISSKLGCNIETVKTSAIQLACKHEGYKLELPKKNEKKTKKRRV